ncbi:MAG TPA: alpha/beta fold hydrolase [Chitinophagaceae bacterium]|nr:alpha/beta fold hydrolase [Chitinophagaceae bacterium]
MIAVGKFSIAQNIAINDSDLLNKGTHLAYHEANNTAQLRAVFNDYNNRFSKAQSQMQQLLPWLEKDRSEIIAIVKETLSIKEEWIPKVTTKIVGRTINKKFVVDQIQFESWKNALGAAHLYTPLNNTKGNKLPVVLLACGHGDGGKLYNSYRLMAENMASNGIAVIVPDNIGQGERSPMGHYNPVGVFDCGLTVQGLIVMETIGWLNWLQGQDQFDHNKVAVCGNSGGGTLGLFLAAIASEKFSALVCSGYPSTFEYVARKEKVHCMCNMVPGIIGRAEMWQVLGCFAPKPMFILQGNSDEFFPVDLFYEVSRKVGDVYQAKKSAPNFKSQVFDGLHGWDETRIRTITQYMCTQFDLPWDASLMLGKWSNSPAPNCFIEWPKRAITVNSLAEQISGRKIKSEFLWEVFPPASLSKNSLKEVHSLPRGDCRVVFAQYEAFLGTKRN